MPCPTFSIKLSKVLEVSSVAAVAIVVVLCWFLVGVFLGVCTRLLETRLVRSATVRNVFPAWFPAQESKRLLPEVLFAPLAAKNKITSGNPDYNFLALFCQKDILFKPTIKIFD